jgi:hypothetical protein
MKTFATCALASAIALAFSVSANAATTDDTMTNASKGQVPAACASMTGKERSDCIRTHKATNATESDKSGKSNMRMQGNNDKSGSGSGSVGGGTGPAGTAGTTGSSGGTAGASGGNGGGPGK